LSYDPAKTKANGSIASIMASTNAIQIADSKIFGAVRYPPNGGYTLGKAGMVGDQAFQSDPANAGKVESGYSDNTLNISIPPAPVPDVSSWLPVVSTVYVWTNGQTYSYVLNNGNFKLAAGTTLKGSILVLGTAQLYIPSDGRVQFGSHDIIKIVSGANLQMQNASTTDAVFTGISNDSGLAPRFGYWGLPTTAGSKVTLTGNGQFAGTIYAPDQKIVLTGGSSGDEDFIGACVGLDITMSGHFYLHYDENLGGSKGITAIASYREL